MNHESRRQSVPLRQVRRWQGLLFCTVALTVVLAPAAALADPTFGVMNASGGIYWRSGPDWNTAEAVAGNGFYPDTTIAVHCYQSGAGNVPGSADTMWEQASIAGGSGTGSGWINEHFINDGSAINQPSPGVPPCNASAPPAQPSITASIGGQYGCGNCSALNIAVHNFPTGTYTYYCHDNSGSSGSDTVFYSHQVSVTDPNQSTWPGVFCDDNSPYTAYLVMDGVTSNSVSFAGSGPAGPPPSTSVSAGTEGPAGSVAPTSSPTAGPPATSGCPGYMVIEARGSGEPYSPNLDAIGQAFATALQNKHRGVRVAKLANPYPAVGLAGSWREFLNLVGAGFGIGPLGAYHASVVRGKQWLSDTVASEIRTCASTKLLLVGYSQGAQVTGDVYQRTLSSSQRSHVLGVALFGDPYFNSSDGRVDRGSYSRTHGGVLGTRGKFASGQPVVSYCHAHDPICNWPGNLAELAYYRLSRHSNYALDGTAASAGGRY